MIKGIFVKKFYIASLLFLFFNITSYATKNITSQEKKKLEEDLVYLIIGANELASLKNDMPEDLLSKVLELPPKKRFIKAKKEMENIIDVYQKTMEEESFRAIANNIFGIYQQLTKNPIFNTFPLEKQMSIFKQCIENREK